jgi:hypothetical protein
MGNLENNVAKAVKKLGHAKDGRRVTIVLEDSADIPPTGLFVGHNGTSYIIKTGEVVSVPAGVMGILRDAIVMKPVLGFNNKFNGATKRTQRFAFQVLGFEGPEEKAA